VILSGNIVESPGKLSLNEAALALTRSLGRRGVKVYRFHPDRSLSDLVSRYCVHVPCPNLYSQPRELIARLVDFAETAAARPVLFPASDGSARFIASNEEILKRHFSLTSPSAACLAETENKRSLLKLAQSAGITIPETCFPSTMAELHGIAESIPFPVIMKPLYSSDWKSDRVRDLIGRVKALKADTAEQLIELGGKVLSLATPFMVQEIIPGPDDNLLTFIGYAGRDGQVLAGCVRKKLRQVPEGFGYCALTESVEDPEIIAQTIKLFRALKYRGIGCVEFKRDPETGAAKLVEINARAVRTSALAIAAGVDFPWIAYQDSINAFSGGPVFSYKVPVRWIHIYDELKSAASLMHDGRLSLFEWLNGFREKGLVAAEFSWDDMRPALLYWSPAPRKALSKLYGRLTGRRKQKRALDAKAAV
jgi:predicted ATP-grasp superfamily ATP-dependent carboligase